MKVVCLSPHTDDIELGCGGTISRLIEEGHDIYPVVFSICNTSLPEGFPLGTLKIECTKSLTSLGIPEKNITYFDYEVRIFNYHRQDILEKLVVLNRSIKPDMVFIPSVDDYHQDHKTIAEEGIRCFKNNCSILSYELIWNNTSFKNQLYYELTEAQIEAKYIALSHYETQRGRRYVSHDFITSLAKVRGIQNGVNLAEAFEVVRFKM